MKRFLLVMTALVWLGSCAPLTKSQVGLSNSYFEIIANHPRFVRQLNQEVSELQLESDNLRGALEASDSIRIYGLITSIDSYEKRLMLPDSINRQLNEINEYIQSYYSIIPNGFGIYQALKGTTETIGGVFGVGGLIGTILPNREPSLSSKKRAQLQQHVLSSEAQLVSTMEYVHDFLQQYYLPLLDSIDERSNRDFRMLLESITKDNTPLAHYTKHNELVTVFYKKLILTRSFVELLSRSFDTLLEVEREVIEQLSERRKVDLSDTHINQLVSEVSKINYVLQDLNQIQFQKAK